MKQQRLTFPVIGYKIREIRLLHFSSIVFIFETIFIQLSYTRVLFKMKASSSRPLVKPGHLGLKLGGSSLDALACKAQTVSV